MTDAEILAAILRREAGYVDDPADHGRCTNMGITIATLREWRRQPVTCADVRALTEQEAREIYQARYLKPFDGVDPAVKGQVVDIAVNAGVSRARALLAIAQQQAARPISTQLVIERLKHYGRLVYADPSQARFMNGWISRAVEFL